MKPTLYLGGAINGRSDADCKNWREYVRTHYAGPTIDPMSRDYRGREDACFVEIVELDKADIDTCDALIISYDRPSVGTSMEILYAWERGKPVYLVRPPGTSLSPWLRYHAAEIFDDFDPALAAIESLP